MNMPHGPGPRKAAMLRLLRARGITDTRVLAAMDAVPRELFAPPEARASAYADGPLRIHEGQTMSQPFIVALMAQAAYVKPSDHVLEVGAGSGYAAAVLARLASHVHAIERLPILANLARHHLMQAGVMNAEIIEADGSEGWPAAAPYDAIIVSAGGPSVPPALQAQLAAGGRLIMPVGQLLDHVQKRSPSPEGPLVHVTEQDLDSQRLIRLTRGSDGTDQMDDLGPVAFVPLIGAQGWPDT